MVQNTENLVVDAPNLKFLVFEGKYKSICFKKILPLVSVSIDSEGTEPEPKEQQSKQEKEQQIMDMLGIFACMPSIKHLSVGEQFFMLMVAGLVPKSLPAGLNCLKSLALCNICLASMVEISCAFWLIRSSPNLRKLQIKVYHIAGDITPVLECLEAQYLDTPMEHLEEVEILKFGGTNPEMEFIKLILAKLPVLKTVKINPHQDVEMEENLV